MTRSTLQMNRPIRQTDGRATIVFFSMDAIGHIQPILSIARELHNRGHRCLVLTARPLSKNIADRLISVGVECDHCQAEATEEELAVEKKIDTEMLWKRIMEPLMNNFRRGPRYAFESTYHLDGVVGTHLVDMIEKKSIIEAKLKQLNADILVYDHLVAIPAINTATKKWVRIYSGFPSVLYSVANENFVAGQGLRLDEMTPEMKNYEIGVKASLRIKLEKFWAENRMPDWPSRVDLLPQSPHLNFYFGPQELDLNNEPSLKPLQKEWTRLEHTIVDEPNKFIVPKCLEKLPGKLIYFSLGTLVTSDVNLINRLLSILGKSANKFIVSMGQMHKHIELKPNMWGDKFVDQRSILAEADLFVSHGGYNSVIESFYFGVPMVVLPVFADQFDCAQRVQDCAFGIRLNPFNCSEEDLLKSIDCLLANNVLKEKMQKISSRLRSIRYDQIAADKLEALLKE